MKKASALWGGTALLIELVILILALVRGDWMIPLLLAVFAGWSLWLIFTQLLPVWKNNRAYRKKEQELREQPVDGSNNLESDGELSKMLLQHVNYRILTILKAAYPNVQWEWTMEDPAAFVTRGGTGRIRLYEVPDYDFADVTLDRRANLRCDLVKVVPAVPDGSPASASGQAPSYEDFQLLSPCCGFPEIFQEMSVDPYGHKAPRCELVYSRSDYDGHRWHTIWFPCWEDRRTQALAQKVDQFMDALLETEEFRSLGQMKRMCRACAEPTSDPTEFNLYWSTSFPKPGASLWIRPDVKGVWCSVLICLFPWSIAISISFNLLILFLYGNNTH